MKSESQDIVRPEVQAPNLPSASSLPRWQKSVGILLYAVGWLVAIFEFCALLFVWHHRYLVERSHNPPVVWPIILRSISRIEMLPLTIGLQSIVSLIVIGSLVYSGRRLMGSPMRSSVRDMLLAMFLLRLLIVVGIVLVLIFADKGDAVGL